MHAPWFASCTVLGLRSSIGEALINSSVNVNVNVSYHPYPYRTLATPDHRTTSPRGAPPGNPRRITARSSKGLLLCKARWSRAIVFETQGGTWNRTRDLSKKGSALWCRSTHAAGTPPRKSFPSASVAFNCFPSASVAVLPVTRSSFEIVDCTAARAAASGLELL